MRRAIPLIVISALAAALGATAGGRRSDPAPAVHAGALLRVGALAPSSRVARQLAWHGGPATASTGDPVTVYVSDAYAPDVNAVQQWADFFAGLVHGPELGLMTAYVATPAEVQSMCSSEDALGCYGDDRIVISGETVDGESPEEVARHEYGHHIAANSVSAPWAAIDWGTKRWASQENVCSRAGAGLAYPGDEGLHYQLNPGEAFAETYRVLNDVRSFGSAIDWPIVDASFLPNAAALQAVEDDVRRPWTGPTTTVLHRGFAAHAQGVWTHSLATPLDGSLSVSLSYRLGARDTIDLIGAAPALMLAHGAPSGATSQSLSFLVCGQRSLKLRVTRHGGAGPFTLRITHP
jgi:hypothetical protein